jgi:MFS family permease
VVTRPGSRWGLLEHTDFRRLWIAQTISQFGTQVSLLAVPLVAISLLQANPFQVALLGTIEFLPFILFSLPAGAWVDRLRRRPILILADVGRALSLGWIPVAWQLGVLTMEQMYAVGFVTGALTVFFDVSYQSYLPSLLERHQILEGNSKLEISRAVAQTAGPAVGGGLIGLIGAPLSITADAISFLGSALFVGRIRSREPKPDAHLDAHGQPRVGVRREVGEGLRYVLGHRYLRTIAASTALSNLFTNMAFATFLVYVVRDLHLEPGVIGVVFAVGNLGAILGAFTATRLGLRFGVGPVIVGSIGLAGPAALLVPMASLGWAVPVLVVSQSLTGFLGVVYNINQVSLRQAITPERMLGRMNATMRFIVWGTIPIGATIGGVIATAVGVTQALWVGTILSCLAFLPVFLGPVRRLREIPSAPGEAPRSEAIQAQGPSQDIVAEAAVSGYEPMGITQPRALVDPGLSGEEGGDPSSERGERQGAGNGQDGRGE